MKSFISLVLIVLSLVGIADAGYISYETAQNIVPPCGNGFDCETVLTSRYAHIGPISLANLGLFYYTVIFILAIALYLEFDLKKVSLFKHHTYLKRTEVIDLLLLCTAGGLVFSLYLLTIMGIVIGAWCKFCLISAATSILLFISTQIYNSTATSHSSFTAKHLTQQIISFLYKILGKPVFFLLDPELVHDTITNIGATLGKFPLFRFKTRWLLQFRHPILVRRLAGITFKNPVGLSAGFDYDGDLTQILPDVGFGFHTIGTVTLEPYEGNAKPRLGRFPNSKALLVNKGLKSMGAVAVIRKLSKLNLRIPTGISIGSTNKGYETDAEQIVDILKCFKLFEQSSLNHAYYELNISCPNTFGGEPFTKPDRLDVLLNALDKLNIKKPVFVKMPIDQSKNESLQLLEVINNHTVAGLIIGNLTKDKTNPAVLPEDRAEWQKKKGNLSGKPTFERSNLLISLAKETYGDRFIIIGTGGIFSADDAWKKISLGADLVQLITGMIFQGPPVIGVINRGLAIRMTDRLK